MWIKNTDKEVERFHPACKKALEDALVKCGLSDKYIVQHHRHVGAIEMDLVIANKTTNRILCVVEVKRTISAVNSTRYQYQAMSYVQSLSDAELETPYYLLTNLEASCLFKYDVNRKNVYQQILQPGIKVNHLFADVSEETFRKDLVAQYADYINEIIDNSGDYLVSFEQFANELNDNINDIFKWKKSLVGLFYEYIRGAFSKIGRRDIRTITQLSEKVDLVCNEGLRINFKDIFTLPPLSGKDRNIETSRSLLRQLFDLGRTYVDADELASVMHKVISNGHEHEGEVPTDSELANVLLWLVKSISGELKDGEQIIDPAAGGGSLLCAAIDVFKDLQPTQIIANDINSHLLQLLSLRLGLRFASTISPQNTATILSKDIANLDKSLFAETKCLVMNPPYLAATGKNCSERKNTLYQRIRELKNDEPTTQKGQMPLEGPFIELTSSLVNDGTVMGAIIPNTHLTTRGEASVAIRKMLLEDFGLTLIFSYPQENLFESVNQNTSIIIGVKGQHAKLIKYLHCNSSIVDIDPTNIIALMLRPFPQESLKSLDNDFEGCTIPHSQMERSLEDGWMIGNIVQQEARNFLNSSLKGLSFMEEIGKSEFSDFNRGKIGNNGCTDLMFLHRNDPFIKSEEKLIRGHLANGFNNAKFKQHDVGEGDCFFLDASTMREVDLKKVVDMFFKEKKKKSKKQRKNQKSSADYIKIVKDESRFITKPYSVLLPRALRATGSVFVTSLPIHVSTNFFIFETTKDKCTILSSWMSTVFFQLECEVKGNNRGGLRKMEKADYERIHVPVTSLLKDDDKEAIKKTSLLPFLNLRQPVARDIDKLWAKILFEDEAEERLQEACDLLAILVAAREK